ncbi:hypothetical protein HFK83_03340 [Ralstonia pseudosolanacearum]|uniref:hypothetical protein n=1 Tax=Ralstonia solanacearum species complex TaxID=3116862 RepID=UPI000362E9BF|nr:hypothetical protein [Ralstonia pseudosolanacearum]MCK4121404.1 hypothetical protein [Ralstonia pseudosolanacearum]
MTTVTINPSPSEQLIKAAAAEVTVQDDKGRTLSLRKPGVLAQYRLVEAVGPEAAKNEVYMAMIMPLIYVASVDGNPVIMPTNKRQVDALIQMLDEEGVAAAMAGVQANFGAPNPEADAEALKKS